MRKKTYVCVQFNLNVEFDARHKSPDDWFHHSQVLIRYTNRRSELLKLYMDARRGL